MDSIVKPCFVRLVRLRTINSSPAESTSTAVTQKLPTKKDLHCPVCNKLCRWNNELEVHIRVHTGERPFSCTICNQKFKSKAQVTQHSSKVHSDRRPFSCIWCEKSFKYNHVLMEHLRMHAKEKPHFCKKCPDVFSTSGSLTKHGLRKHNPVKGKNKRCKCCAKMCFTATELQVHRRVHSGEKPFVCLVCGKYFTRKSSLVEHSGIHSENRPLKCTKCPKTFKIKRILRSHIRNVHENVRRYSCRICGKTYFSKGNRDEHINSHLNEKPHQCPKCPKRFAHRHSVLYHLKAFHDQRKDFKCSKCAHSFVDQAHLNEHFLRRHANPSERPLACLFCSKRYCKRNQFEDHLRSHLNENPYFCTLCPTSFSYGTTLRYHLVRDH